MAEIAGLALVAAGLAGICSVAIEAFGHISAAHPSSRDLEVLSTRYDIRRTRMLQWGDAVALLSDTREEQDPRLHDEKIQPLVDHAINCITSLLTNGDKLKERYGLQPLDGIDRKPDGDDNEDATTAAGLLSRNRLKTFRVAFARLKGRRGCNTSGGPTVATKAKWAVNGADRSRLLLTDLDGLIEDLYKLVPIIPGYHRLIVKEDIDGLPEDMGALKLVEEASATDVLDTESMRANGSWLEQVTVRIEASERVSQCQQQVTAWLRDVATQYDTGTDEQGQRSSVLDSVPEADWRKLMDGGALQHSVAEYVAKKRKRRELHDAVQRRRRDAINVIVDELLVCDDMRYGPVLELFD